MVKSQDVLGALRTVMPTGEDKDVVSSGRIKNLFVNEGVVRFELVHTPGGDEGLQGQCHQAVSSLGGVERVEITQTDAPPPQVRKVMPKVTHVVAVASGKGGVGKSTTAVNLAASLAAGGWRVGLLDADIYGPSLPTMLGVHEEPRPAGKSMIHPVSAHGMQVMSIGFLIDPDQPMIWRGPMVHGALQQFLEQVEWGELDLVIVDMPPGTGDAQLTLTQKAPLSGAVIVSTPQEVALADARKGLRMFEQVKVPVLGILENMSSFECDGCGKLHDLLLQGGGERTALELGIPFLGAVPLAPGVAASGDEGEPIVLRNPESPAAKAFQNAAKMVQEALLGQVQTDTESLRMSWEG